MSRSRGLQVPLLRLFTCTNLRYRETPMNTDPMHVTLAKAAIANTRRPVRDRAEVVICDGKGNLLVERLMDPAHPDNLNKLRFPGGKIELGEDVFRTIVREMREEYSIDLSSYNFDLVGSATGYRGTVFRIALMDIKVFNKLKDQISSTGKERLEVSQHDPGYWF